MNPNKLSSQLEETLDKDIDSKNLNLWPAVQAKVGSVPAAGRRMPRFALAALALVAVISGVIFLGRPAPVSAHQVMERAAEVKLPANQFIHRTYRSSPTGAAGPALNTYELWLRVDANGMIAQSAYTVTLYDASGAVTEKNYVLVDFTTDQFWDYAYTVSTNEAWTRSGTNSLMMGGMPDFSDGASVASYLKQIADDDDDAVVLLPDQNFQGKPALALHIADQGKGSMTAYFDPQTYKLLGIDDGGTTMWLETEEVVDADDVPPNTFTLITPLGAEVHETIYGDPAK